MGRGLGGFWPVGISPIRRGHFMVPFRWSMAGSTGLDFVGRRILREKALATEMVSRKLDSDAFLLRTRLRCSGSVTINNFRFSVSYSNLDNSHFHLVTGRRAADENQ